MKGFIKHVPENVSNHPLFKGSLVESQLRMGILTWDWLDAHIKDQAAKHSRIDDLTPNEVSFQAALVEWNTVVWE